MKLARIISFVHRFRRSEAEMCSGDCGKDFILNSSSANPPCLVATDFGCLRLTILSTLSKRTGSTKGYFFIRSVVGYGRRESNMTEAA